MKILTTTITLALIACSAIAEQQPTTEITWKQVDAIYNVKSNKTDMQKESAWTQLKGKHVTWAGKVVDISEGWFGGVSLCVKMNKSTLTFDVMISLKDSEKAKAMSLSKDSIVRFSGTLQTWGTLLPMSLADGEIVQSKS
jgi:hypothetical protein